MVKFTPKIMKNEIMAYFPLMIVYELYVDIPSTTTVLISCLGTGKK